jgi:hypothetical protein
MPQIPTDTPEGVFSDALGSDRVLSLSEIETIDLLSEGQVEGLNSGEYLFSGFAGEIGWRKVIFNSFPDAPETSTKYLKSIFWNEVPVVSSLNKYNFQRVDTSFTPGTPNGSLIDQSTPELTISRTIGERLRGSEVDAQGNPIDSSVDYAKYYRILNKEANGAILNVRVAQLSATITSTTNANANELGKIIDTSVFYKIFYRPLFSDIENQYVNNNLINSTADQDSKFVLAGQETIRGKITQGYVKSTQINFDRTITEQRNFYGWEIKVVRITPDSFESTLRNQTFIDSITEIYGNSYLYPNSCMVRSKFSAEFFQQVPSRAFDLRGLKVKIPANYDPIKKTYAADGPGTINGGWDGTMTEEKYWTDNPVWCYYDLLTNKRYGLGEYLEEENIDKITLYEISKYCDTLVSDGFGTLEPRFTCNLSINSREEAYKVVNDFASIFRGITYYNNGLIYAVQDSPKEPLVTFTNANVEQGKFNYSSSSRKLRSTIAVVRYNDKTNFFEPAIEYVEDFEGIRRYGIREKEVTAFGCTSRGQAVRLGRWYLLSENTETETVSLVAGTEANYLRPGDLFWVYDNERKQKQHAGRTYSISQNVTGHQITIDRMIFLPTGETFEFNLLTPSYNYDSFEVSGLDSNDTAEIRRNFIQKGYFSGYQITSGNNKSTIQLNTTFDTTNYYVGEDQIWSIAYPSGSNVYSDSSQYLSSGEDIYRAISIAEEEIGKYRIQGLQYNPDKFIQIESGLGFETNITVNNITPEAPSLLNLSVHSFDAANQTIHYSFTVDNLNGVTSYRVFAKKDDFESTDVPSDDYLIANLPYNTTDSSHTPTEGGDYYFRVYSVNDFGNLMSAGYAEANITLNNQQAAQSIIIGSLNFEGFNLERPENLSLVGPSGEQSIISSGEYYFESPVFKWQLGKMNNNQSLSNFKYRVTVRAPSSGQTINIPSPVIYYQESGLEPDGGDPKFVFDIDKNITYAGGVREYDFIVEAIDSSGKTSAGNTYNALNPPYYFDEIWENPYGYDIFYVNNPRPTGINITGAGSIYLNTGWIDSNGTSYILFTGGSGLRDSIIGGYIYGSTGIFSGQNVTGNIPSLYPIYTGEFEYDHTRKLAKTELLFANIPMKTGYIAVSFYDIFDDAARERGVNIRTGLYVSNVYGIKPRGLVENLTISNNLTVLNRGNGEINNLYVETDSNGYKVTYYENKDGIKYIIRSES